MGTRSSASLSAGAPGAGGRLRPRRVLSSRLRDSTLITSAPASASSRPATGPAKTQLMSSTRTPLKGKEDGIALAPET